MNRWITTTAFVPLLVAPSLKAAGFKEILGVDLTVVSLAILAALAFSRLVHSPRFAFKPLLVLVPFAFVSAFGLLRVPLDDVAVKRVGDSLIAIVAVLALPLIVRTLHDLEGLNLAWLLAGVITACLVLSVGGSQTLWGRGGINETYLGPAYLCGVGLVVAASTLLDRSLPLWLGIGSGLLCGIGLIGTGSRGPLVGLAVSLVALMVLRRLTNPRTFAALGATMAALLLGVRFASDASLTNILSDDRTRPHLWSIAWDQFIENPILGGGWASYVHAAWDGGYFWVTYPHNLFLEVLAEFGALGLVGLLFILGAATRRVWLARQWPTVCTSGVIAAYWLTGQQLSYELSNRLLWIALAACLIVPSLTDVSRIQSAVRGPHSTARMRTPRPTVVAHE